MKKYSPKHRIFTGLLLVVVTLTALAPVSYRDFEVQEVEAQLVCGGLSGLFGFLGFGGGTQCVEEVGVVRANSIAERAQETIGDRFAYFLAKQFLRQMVNSIVTWINSGFQGSPAFITDFESFLFDAADAAVGEFVYNDPGLNFLCSPFQLDVKIAILTQFSASQADNYQPQCTLSDVVGNVDGFLNGSFQDGGWEGWFQMTQQEVNNPMGAYLSAQSEAYIRIINAQGQEIEKVGWGNGFMSLEICDVADMQSGARPNCVIGTPGSVIADSINEALAAPGRELIAADEINEIFNALFSQLAQQAIGGVFGGLRGLTSGGGSGSGSGSGSSARALDQLTDLSNVNNTVDPNLGGGSSPIKQALTDENTYLTLQSQIVGRINAAETNYLNIEASQAALSCSLSFAFPSNLLNDRANAQNEVSQTNLLIQLLTAMDSAFDNATDVNDQINTMNQFTQLQSSLHTQTDITQAAFYIQNSLIPDIDQIDTNLTNDQNQCP